jgi:hypothetical protein
MQLFANADEPLTSRQRLTLVCIGGLTAAIVFFAAWYLSHIPLCVCK